jgi:hypothetical protein
MPNLWTTTSQRIYEAFNGPRARDLEYDAKIDEVRKVQQGILQMKAIFRNFQGNTQGIDYNNY